MIRTLVVVSLLAMLVLSGTVQAKKTTVLNADTFRVNEDRFESDIETPGIDPHIDDAQREAVRASLAKIMTVLVEHDASGKLDGPQKVEPVNKQQLVNQILTNRPVSSRHVCRYERRTDPRRLMLRYQTVAEIEETRAAATGAMHGKLHSTMEGDGA